MVLPTHLIGYVFMYKAYSITRRRLTDVHIVPDDSDSPIRTLLKVQAVRRALVLYKGN